MPPELRSEARETDVVLGHLGALLLDAGTSVTDVRDALEQVRDAASPGSRAAFSVLPELVIVNEPEVPGAVSMSNAGGEELSFRQAAHASRLTQRLEKRTLGLADVPAEIARIRGIRRHHPALQWIAGAALISSGLAVLFRCPWWAIVVATLVGAVVGLITRLMTRVPSAAAIIPFVATFVSTILVGWSAGWLELGPVPLFAVCAPIAIIVPGALITNALLELTATDIVTGSARLVYGIIILGFMTAGIVAGGALTGLRVDPTSAALVGETVGVSSERSGWEALPPLWLAWVGVVLVAIGIGMAFGSGFRLTVVGIVVMACTYAVLVLIGPIVGSVVAVGVAAAALFVAARVLERLTLAVPATVSFQSAFLLLVPGTVGLVALASFDPQALSATPMTFVSLCIGTKVGALLVDVARAVRRRL
ncbi:threonine/serine exporter family protein [Microbacterium sp. ASV49]|uniref:Threonine/serine exporter family protein n=1 Tax=Microbacterium candidum TaxID=3041922 RepID=A0ABT7MUV3_9MICO|nr:threonine/serine exporter family protein [Microbacterium sp. ASV49]MDL9978230.1 threonine/serine exporter family protein [Microbacterium sp. ASV49]